MKKNNGTTKELNLNDWLWSIAQNLEKDKESNMIVAYKTEIPENSEALERLNSQVSMFLSLMVKRVVYLRFSQPNGDWKEGDIAFYKCQSVPDAHIRFRNDKAEVEEVKDAKSTKQD